MTHLLHQAGGDMPASMSMLSRPQVGWSSGMIFARVRKNPGSISAPAFCQHMYQLCRADTIITAKGTTTPVGLQHTRGHPIGLQDRAAWRRRLRAEADVPERLAVFSICIIFASGARNPRLNHQNHISRTWYAGYAMPQAAEPTRPGAMHNI